MRKFHLLLLLLLQNYCWAQDSIETKEDFSKRIFEAIVAQNEEVLKSCYIIETEIVQIFELHLPEELKESAKQRGAAQAQKLERWIPMDFQELKKETEAEKINWKKAKFISFDAQNVEGAPFEAYNIHILMNHEGTDYQINLSDCWLVGNKWKITKSIWMQKV